MSPPLLPLPFTFNLLGQVERRKITLLVLPRKFRFYLLSKLILGASSVLTLNMYPEDLQ